MGTLPSIGLVVVVVGLLNLAGHIPARPALGVEALTGFIGGGWCSLNFWRCRHAHCLVTGPGWLIFALFVLVEAAIGHSLIGGYEQPAFFGILGVAVIFEVAWYLTHRTNAVVAHPG